MKLKTERISKFFQKYRLPMLILLLGVFLMLLPQHGDRNEKETSLPSEELELAETQLAEILSRVDGAGQVRVMLSIAESSEIVYQTDLEEEYRENDILRQEHTVLADLTGSDEMPLSRKTIAPVYRGAIVVAEGGDRPAVCLDLVHAVSSLTGLGADKITVVKMKVN